MRPGFDVRLEKSQNLVSTNDPEVIESFKASCNGIGMSMAGVATFVVLGFFFLAMLWTGPRRQSCAKVVAVAVLGLFEA